MLRGTRVLGFKETRDFNNVINGVKRICASQGFEEMIFPAIWDTSTFTDKLGADKEAQMWAFSDKKGRNCCLVPEVTGIVQELWRDQWSKAGKPLRIFYVSRCYRYERPQAGRYREFTQIGVEFLGGERPADRDEVVSLLVEVMDSLGIEYAFKDSVKRGLSYYVDDGFEVECPLLGAQKQVAGGGRYAEGAGWAIGVERLVMACDRRSQ